MDRADEAPLPYPLRCQGYRKDGRRCRTVLAVFDRGIVTMRHHGRTVVDPASTSCDKCGMVRSFRGGVPEEHGGSSGVVVDGALVGARPAA